ncbi:MAG: SixA phosphatase family protein [Acidimicrobiales bacterium]
MNSRPTCHIFLIRHASAGKRTAAQSDHLRELDDTGLRQAKNIARSLSAYSIDHIMTSPAVRCVETVQPLADELGLTVDVSEALWEGQGPMPALSLVKRLLAADSTAALCSHGDIIPELLRTLEREHGIATGHQCAKASVWALDGYGGTVRSARYLGTP